MDIATDFAASIRYALTERRGAGGPVELVLDLFRGARPVLSRTIADLAPEQAAAVASRCRARLEECGAHAVARAAAPDADRHAVPTPDWVFAG